MSQSHVNKLLAEISELRNQLMSAHKEIALLLKENRDLRDALGVVNGEHYGSSKSRKGIGKQRNTKGRNGGRSDVQQVSNVHSLLSRNKESSG